MSIGKAPLRGLLAIVSFGLGLAITLTVYGVALSYIGKIAGFGQINLRMAFVGGLIAFVFGLWLMKLLPFELPSWGVPAFVQRSASWSIPFLTGVSLGNWGIGCPDPVFYALIVYLATIGDVAHGALMSAIYAAGRSLPIVALSVLGLLGVNTLPFLLNRRLAIERFFGWTLAAFGAFVMSRFFSGWYLATWFHEAWNWTLYSINANFGEIRASDHPHLHEGSVTGFLFFVAAGFLIPGLWLYARRLAGWTAPVTAAATSVAFWLLFYIPPVFVPDLTDRFARALRPAPVWAPDGVLPRSAAPVVHAHSGAHGSQAPADPIVASETVEKVLRDPSVRILDVRSADDYRSRHVPNAVNLPYDVVQNPESRIVGKRLGDQDLGQRFGEAGIGAKSWVIVYDDRDGSHAARIAWLLLYLGHERVSILDGGFPRWLAERRPIDRRVIEPRRAAFPVDVKPHFEATAAFVIERLTAPQTVVVDVRTRAAYAAARVPGAISLHWRQNLIAGPAPVWKRPEELRTMYEAAGVTKDKTVVVQGDVADLSHHTVLTLRALGYPHVRSYDRSWAEWGPDSNLPKVDAQGRLLLVAEITR